MTEFGWDTRPPIRYGIPESLQQTYLSKAFYLLYQEGVDAATWYRIVDRETVEDSPSGHFPGMGVHRYSGAEKPSADAFEFMFATKRTGSRQIEFWGRAPTGGQVDIQRRNSTGGWVTLATSPTGQSQVFEGSSQVRSGTVKLRARQGSLTSPVWEQK